MENKHVFVNNLYFAVNDDYTAHVSIENIEDCNEELSIPPLVKIENTTYPVSEILDFKDCKRLKKIILPDSIKEISTEAFAGCANLESIDFSKKLEKIGCGAFKGCKNLKKVMSPYSVKEIYDEAFAGCENLESFDFKSIEKIGTYAFKGCKKLGNRIELPTCLKSLGRNAFECNTLVINSMVEYEGEWENVTCVEYNAWKAESFAFSGAKDLRKVVITNSCSQLGENLFFQHDGIKEVVIQGSFESIGNALEFSKSKLGNPIKKLYIESVRKVDDGDISGVEEIVINKIDRVGESAFLYDKNLKSIKLGEGIKTIGKEAFNGCENLPVVSLPNSLEEIGENAFEATGLTTVVIPNSVKKIGTGAFSSCKNLNTVSLPNSLEEIGENAFEATGLTTVVIPNSVKKIGTGAFSSCKNLNTVSLPNSLEEIGENAFEATGLTTVVIPNSVKKIGTGAFSSCKNLNTVSLPNSLEEIGEFAFYSTDLTTVVIPNSVKKIGASAFSSCENLINVLIDNKRENVVIEDGAFSDMTIVHFKDDKQETTKSQTVTENIVETKSLDKSVNVTPKKENKKINIMAKKSAISGEYVISVEDSGSIVVYRIFDNVIASLREVAEVKGFEYDTKWNTRQFGSKLCKEFGDGKSAEIGNYFITVKADGGIETYRTYDNTIEALRTIAENIGFTADPNWNTRQFGSKLIDEINK
ncbi:MAG: leucine-rich repeat domain-containing protein [Bacteroidales bacterium]|nr:leucine-rich repeat domain-containing protein [Bacteroidales bacterium]